VAAIAVAAAAVAAVVAWAGRGEDAPPRARAVPRQGAPPRRLDPIIPDARISQALREAESLYDKGRRAEAGRAFAGILERDPGLLPAQIGQAVASWPHGTVAQLQALARAHPDSGAVELELGLALLWAGQARAATIHWQRAEHVEPDRPAAIFAEALLHPEMPPDRPLFVPGTPGPASIAALASPYDQLEALRRRALEKQSERAWLDYGAALQRALRPLSAQAAFERAAQLAPDDPEALTAAAVARFDKDDPSLAIGRLGQLTQRFPDAAVVRFHFGLCLLWLQGFADRASEQLRRAAASQPGSIWSREASDLLKRLGTEPTGQGRR
jgi:tetratricopeptide (TPR) repeat protein